MGWRKVAKELLGVDALNGLSLDAKVLFGNKVCRALAFGLSSVVLAQYLSLLGLADRSIGLLMTCTLLGDSAVSLLVTLTADRLGRRLMLLLGASLKLLGALIFALANKDRWLLLLFGATVGVISPSGNEVGPFQTLEQSILSEQVEPHKRTKLFNIYNLVGYMATASGQVAAGVAVDILSSTSGMHRVGAYRIIFLFYGLLASVLMLLSFLLSSSCEGAAWRGSIKVQNHRYALLTHEDDDREVDDIGQLLSLRPPEQLAAQGSVKVKDGPHSSCWSVQRARQVVAVTVDGSKANTTLSKPQPAQLSQHAQTIHPPPRLSSNPQQPLSSTSSSSESADFMGSAHKGSEICCVVPTPQPQQQPQQQQPLRKLQPLNVCHSSRSAASLCALESMPPPRSLVSNMLDSCRSRLPFHRLPFNSPSHIFSPEHCGSSTKPHLAHTHSDRPPVPTHKLISGKSLRLILGLSLLLMVDSMGTGMIPGTFIVYYLHTTFHFSQSLLGSLLSVSSTVAGFAGLLAGWLSDRMGLVRTMVFTHLPSSFMLLLVPFTPPAVALTMIVTRSCLGRMDVGPRQSYISGIVPAHERTAALGITNVLRSLGAAMGPLVTGHLASKGLWPQVFCVSGGLMIVYNIALLVFFNALKAEHETVTSHQAISQPSEQPLQKKDSSDQLRDLPVRP